MVVPIVVAAAATVARYAIKWGVKKAAQKYGKTAVTNSMKGVRGAKRKVKETGTDYTGTAANPNPQTSKPARMPKQKIIQGPKHPKGMGFNTGGKVLKKVRKLKIYKK